MKIGGQIAYFGLQDWWLNDLTSDERNTILAVYQPMTFGGGSGNSLIDGNVSRSGGTAIGLLWMLAGWFKKPEHRTIGYKIIKKAERMVCSDTKILDLHFLYQTKMEVYYRNRNNDEFALPLAIEACKQQIAISEKAKIAFLEEYGSLPSHEGYKQLCIIMEKQKNFEEVIRLSKIAREQGWVGDWDKRIEKCEKRLGH